jgi:Rieske 2Fe-2S family protein
MAKIIPSPGETLAQRFFIDANVFAEETEKIFRARWLFLERASVLENVGDFISTDLEGEGLIAVRGGDDAIRVFYNVCRHRGTRLCNEAKGNRTRVFTCPYHAWSYGLDGALIGAPHMDETEGFNKADFPLKSPAHAKWEGGVFVNLGDDPEPFEQAYAPVLTKFAPWHLGELRPAHREVYEVAANWKLIVQNYSECYHCPIIHPALEKLSHYRDTENDLEEGPFLGGPMRIGHEGGGLSRDGQRTAPPLPGVEGENLQRAFYYVLFPTLLLSVQPDFVLMHHLQRVAPNHTRIVCQWLYHPETIAGKSFNPQPTIDLWDEVNRQDWHVSELTQKGIASRAYTPGPYSSLEGMPAAFDCEYLKAMGRG